MLDVKKFALDNPIVPVVVIDRVEDAIPTGKALLAGGIKVAEVTFRTQAAPEAIAAMATLEDLCVGAGTVINAEQAELAIEKGSKFLVSPGFLPEIAEVAKDKDILYLPGAVNPSQIMECLKWGYEVLKFFPAEAMGGLPVIKALRGPFPQVKFMPTGGVKPANLEAWLGDEAIAACGGTWIATAKLIAAGDFDQIATLAREATQQAQQIRSGH